MAGQQLDCDPPGWHDYTEHLVEVPRTFWQRLLSALKRRFSGST